MKLFKRTALAVALSAAATAPALAVDEVLEFTGGGNATVVLADVIFGNGKPGTGSEETLITAPSVTFDLTNGGANVGDDGTIASVATIKFTLGGGAVFGEDLSTTTLVDASNGGTGAFSLNENGGNTGITYQVVQGGAIGDNTITFELTFGADGDILEGATFEGYAVKNLTSALNPDSASKMVQLGVEYVESVDNGPDAIASTATDTPLVIFGSQAPVDLEATPVDFTSTVRINVGNGETTFTDANSNFTSAEDGRSDFDPAGDVSLVSLGTLQLSLEDVDTTVFTTAPVGKVKKENGDDFDFQGGDVHSLSFAVGLGQLQEGSTVFLSSSADCSTTAFTANTISDDELTSFDIEISGTTTELTSPYEVCYQVKTGTDADTIPEVGMITATWNIDFFNARYDNVEESAGEFGDLLRNGCIASFFNVPAVGNSDMAYIRLTNTSTTNEGDIRGTLYAQDGTVLGQQDLTIAPDLAVHATQIFSTEGADRTTASGQEIIDIESAFGVDGATEYKGRARLVLKGAFDTCEGQGLIRTAGGSLFNMTSTTQGNEAALPNAGNNGN